MARVNRLAIGAIARYTVHPMSSLFRLGYLVPEFPRQTHIFSGASASSSAVAASSRCFFQRVARLRRLSARVPRPGRRGHALRFSAAGDQRDRICWPAPRVHFRHCVTGSGCGGSVKSGLKYLGLLVCAAHLARYCRRQV